MFLFACKGKKRLVLGGYMSPFTAPLHGFESSRCLGQTPSALHRSTGEAARTPIDESYLGNCGSILRTASSLLCSLMNRMLA